MPEWLYGLFFGVGGGIALFTRCFPVAGMRGFRTLLFGGGASMSIALVLVLTGQSSLPTFQPFYNLGKAAVLITAGTLVGRLILSQMISAAPAARSQSRTESLLHPQVILGARLLMASYYGVTGAFKLILPDPSYTFFRTSGYSWTFFYFIAIVECGNALGLLWRRTAPFAALVLLIDMLGAIFTHFHNYFALGLSDPFGSSLDALKMLPCLLLIISTLRRPSPRSVENLDDREHF